MSSSTTTQIPGYVVGTWDIDASHSTVGFSVRHMMVSKVRGYFREFSGELVTAEDLADHHVADRETDGRVRGVDVPGADDVAGDLAEGAGHGVSKSLSV